MARGVCGSSADQMQTVRGQPKVNNTTKYSSSTYHILSAQSCSCSSIVHTSLKRQKLTKRATALFEEFPTRRELWNAFTVL